MSALPSDSVAAESLPPLFYCPDLPETVGSRARLAGDEAQHALAVRRLQLHDDIALFDGHGTLARAVVTALDRKRRTLEAKLTERRRQPAPRPAVHLACALPKGDRAAVLLDMATQLGLARFTPLLCARGVVKPNANTLERLGRIGLEACKQSRRAYLPEIEPPAPPREVARRAPAGNLWIAHPAADAVPVAAVTATNTLTLLIGPEGGFTDEEVRDAVAAGARACRLGAGILRVETAAVAALAAIVLTGPGSR